MRFDEDFYTQRREDAKVRGGSLSANRLITFPNRTNTFSALRLGAFAFKHDCVSQPLG